MKRIVFLSGTRADFGKLKSLIKIVDEHPGYEAHIFVTGMHLLKTYGYTLIEVERAGFSNIHTFSNHTSETSMDLTLAKTVEGFSAYVKQVEPDLIVIHGDRVEALAGAVVGSLNNILVAHIEGGEVSGTIDELIRHSTSKMSHIHFVSNEDAGRRLQQMGELEESIYVIGSPDIDLMFSDDIPSLTEAKEHYQLDFDSYALAMFHPVTTEIDKLADHALAFVEALKQSDRNYILVYPNNDLGSSAIINAYKILQGHRRIRIFPSIRFEYFLSLLKNADFIIGNSSAGIREAPYYGIPTVNIGSRQQNRSLHKHILNTSYSVPAILSAIEDTEGLEVSKKQAFGSGQSAKQFLESLETEEFWSISHQKQFKDIDG